MSLEPLELDDNSYTTLNGNENNELDILQNVRYDKPDTREEDNKQLFESSKNESQDIVVSSCFSNLWLLLQIISTYVAALWPKYD